MEVRIASRVMGTELQTDGPFARLGSKRKDQTASLGTTAASSGPPQNSVEPGLAEKCFTEGLPAVSTHQLEFCYSGIGIPSSIAILIGGSATRYITSLL